MPAFSFPVLNPGGFWEITNEFISPNFKGKGGRLDLIWFDYSRGR